MRKIGIEHNQLFMYFNDINQQVIFKTKFVYYQHITCILKILKANKRKNRNGLISIYWATCIDNIPNSNKKPRKY